MHYYENFCDQLTKQLRNEIIALESGLCQEQEIGSVIRELDDKVALWEDILESMEGLE